MQAAKVSKRHRRKVPPKSFEDLESGEPRPTRQRKRARPQNIPYSKALPITSEHLESGEPRPTRQCQKDGSPTVARVYVAKRRRSIGSLSEAKASGVSETVEKEEDKGQNVEPTEIMQSSTFGEDDDEEFPSFMSSSPSQDKKQFEKDEIVWIKYKGTFWPSLITGVHRNHVNYKFINESRKKAHTFRANFHHIRKFDDPKRNAHLLKEGREKYPQLVEAYNRVVQYYCHLSTQKDLSALKFLTYDKVGDLLYGIVPEDGSALENIDEETSSLTDAASNENEGSDCDSENDNSTDTEKVNASAEHSFSDSCVSLNDLDNEVLTKKYNVLLSFIDTEDCFELFGNIYCKHIPSERMDLFLQNEELELACKSGLGPFSHVNNKNITDRLLDIIGTHLQKLEISQPSLKQKDSSVFLRHVMLPEAIIFALQKYFHSDRSHAEQFFEEGKDLQAEPQA